MHLEDEEKKKILKLSEQMSKEDVKQTILELKDREIKLLEKYSDSPEFKSITMLHIAALLRASYQFDESDTK